MHAQLLSQSPLLMLPLAALLLFATVFIAVSVRALLTSRAAVDAASALPLVDDGEVRHDT